MGEFEVNFLQSKMVKLVRISLTKNGKCCYFFKYSGQIQVLPCVSPITYIYSVNDDDDGCEYLLTMTTTTTDARSIC